MLRKLLLFGSGWFGVIALSACEEPVERAPFAPPCEVCPAGQIRSLPFTGPDAPGGGGDPDAGVPESALFGFVGVLASEDLQTVTPLVGMDVEVSAPGANAEEVTTLTDGSEAYVLGGVARGNPTWVTVADDVGPELFPTVQAIDTLVLTRRDLFIASSAVLESLITSAPLSGPAALDPDSGHLVTFIRDRGGNPSPGVSFDSQLGSTVAYDAGDSFSDQFNETQERGAILVFNIPAREPPGTDELIRLSDDQGTFVTAVRIVRGALTLTAITR